jgi:VacB/RNase II family 3'-5' exoribonuclease
MIKRKMENSKHNKYHEGNIVRVVKQVNEEEHNGISLIKGTLERDYDSNKLFLRKDNHKYFVTTGKTASAYPFDVVTILINSVTKEIEVKDIIKRKHDKHVFECIEKNGVKKWSPVGTEYFEIEEKPRERDQIGQRVLASLTKVDDKYTINIEKEINAKTKIEKVVVSSLLEHGFNTSFSTRALNEAEKVAISKDNFPRRDLRNLETFTIDSYHAKDLDDAISLTREKDNFILYVSIADVSFYVRPGMQLFEEALTKTTSIYPANTVSPMLPTILSNNACSLNPNEDKYALTLKVILDSMGNTKDFEILPSIIRSNLKMSYEKVDNLLLGKDKPLEYLPHYKTLINMYHLANLLQNKRLEKGMLGLEGIDINFDIDDLGNPLSINERFKGPASMMIENFMLLANQTVADFAYYLGIPFVYRNHEGPDFSKRKNL